MRMQPIWNSTLKSSIMVDIHCTAADTLVMTEYCWGNIRIAAGSRLLCKQNVRYTSSTRRQQEHVLRRVNPVNRYPSTLPNTLKAQMGQISKGTCHIQKNLGSFPLCSPPRPHTLLLPSLPSFSDLFTRWPPIRFDDCTKPWNQRRRPGRSCWDPWNVAHHTTFLCCSLLPFLRLKYIRTKTRSTESLGVEVAIISAKRIDHTNLCNTYAAQNTTNVHETIGFNLPLNLVLRRRISGGYT